MPNTFDWEVTKLSPTQKNIADFIERNASQLPYLTENDIARGVGTSIASVSRFWQAVGSANLKEFKSKHRELHSVTPAVKMKNIINKLSSEDVVGDMLELTTNYLQETSRNLVREDFNKAVDVLAQGRKTYIFAPGPAEGLGQLLHFRLNRLGIPSETIEKSGAQLFESILPLNEQDVIVIFGFFSLIAEIKVLLDYASELKCTTIVITDRLVSDLNAQASILLYACRGQIGDFHPMVAPTAVVESLVLAVGLHIESQALTHLNRLQSLRHRYSNYIPY